MLVLQSHRPQGERNSSDSEVFLFLGTKHLSCNTIPIPLFRQSCHPNQDKTHPPEWTSEDLLLAVDNVFLERRSEIQIVRLVLFEETLP